MKVAILCILLVLTGVAHAAEEGPPTISVAFSDVNVGDALTAISQKGGVTVLGDASVKGKVTCNLSDVTVEQALDTVCRTNKLEWLKAYASPDPEGKLSVAKLFKLLDALRELGHSTLICVDPKSRAQTVFLPNVQPGSIELPAMAESLKLKPVYLIRAEAERRAAKAAKEKAKLAAQDGGVAAFGVPPADPTAAAQQVFDYFGQMPFEQRFEVMREMGRMFRDSMTPEQREAMRERFRRGGFRGEGSRREGRPPWADQSPHAPGGPH